MNGIGVELFLLLSIHGHRVDVDRLICPLVAAWGTIKNYGELVSDMRIECHAIACSGFVNPGILSAIIKMRAESMPCHRVFRPRRPGNIKKQN